MISRTAADPGIQFVGNIARFFSVWTAVALSAVKLIRSGVILASGCRYCHGKWNDSSGISVATQSIRHQSESSVSGLATASNFYARQIARCMAIWRKILSTDKKIGLSSPFIVTYVT